MWSPMYPTEKFDIIIKIQEKEKPEEFNTNTAIEQIEKELKNHATSYYLKESEFINVLMVELQKNKLKTALKLAKASSPNKFEMIPIERVVLTQPEKILKEIFNISKYKIKDGETFTIQCHIRGDRYIKTKEEFINLIYNEIQKANVKPDENNPDWIIHIEVVGENTGISVLKQNI